MTDVRFTQARRTEAGAENPDIRFTQARRTEVGAENPAIRFTQVRRTEVGAENPAVRATQIRRTVVVAVNAVATVTQVSAEVIADVVAHAPNQRVTQVSLEVICEPVVTILTPSPLIDAFEGDPYSTFIVASGGLGAITFAVTAGTPPTGFSLNAATGEITGPFTQNGTFIFDITATDHVGNSATVTYTLFVDTVADLVAAETENINLGIGVFGLGYTVRRGLSGVEAHFEMVDVGLGTDTSSKIYLRSATNFPKNYFPDDQLFYLEIVGANVNPTTACTWTVTNGTYSQTIVQPPNQFGRLRNSAPFLGPAGGYHVSVSAMPTLNDATVQVVRIVAPLKRAQKFVSEVRLTNAGTTSGSDQTIGGPDLFRTSSAGHVGFDDNWVSTGQPVFRFDAEVWQRLLYATVYIVMANASFPDQVGFKFSEIAFVDIDDIGEFGFTRKMSTAGQNVFLTPTQYVININPTSLRDGHRYQLYARSVKPDGYFSFNTYLHTGRLQLIMDPGNNAEIYNRCGPSKRVYLPGFMVPNPEIYFQVESATVEVNTLSHLGASTPAGNSTTGPGTAIPASVINSAVNDSVRTAELSASLVAGRDYHSSPNTGELVYRFGKIIKHSHNYMF